MTKFRTDGRDVAPKVTSKRNKPGELPPNRIPVIDGHGHRRGHVGYKASAATANRFGVHDAKLVTHEGRPAWQGMTLAEASCAGTNPAMPKPQIGGTNEQI